MKTLDFIAIGHACHDTAPLGFIPGGAVTYSALFAKKLGLDTGVLTSIGSDYLFKNLFKEIAFQTIPAAATTIFQNITQGDQRQQHLLARANDLKAAHLPNTWQNAKMVFLGPIADEVHFDFLDTFKNAMICINPQGWMRQWDARGKVSYKPFERFDQLAKADITIISEEDVNFSQKYIQLFAEVSNMLVVTKGSKGCEVYTNKQKYFFPAVPTKVLDSTGAGDVFSTAFLIFYFKTKDLSLAAEYANIAASFCIEATGINSLPSLADIKTRLKKR